MEKSLLKPMKEANATGGEVFTELKGTNYFAALGKYPITLKYGLSRVLLIGTCYYLASVKWG